MKDIVIGGFVEGKLPYIGDQARTLEWLGEAHTWAQATLDNLSTEERRNLGRSMRRRVARFACDPSRIARRGSVLPDFVRERFDEMEIYDVSRRPDGAGSAARNAVFARAVGEYFDSSYAKESAPADDLVHVTCTGYVAPSAAMELVAKRGWGERTRVTHVYHMGCNASLSALRIATGLAEPGRRVDVVHTELCTLHLDPTDHSAEQLVVQSLFADGLIRYHLTGGGSGLRVLALDEIIVPDSGDSMRWSVGDRGMHMTLARDVPDRIAEGLRAFIERLTERAGVASAPLDRAIFAVHPGGPRVIDQVAETLGLADGQVAASRRILRDHGNMSSATLPHVWKLIAEDEAVAPGTLIVSLAFGPGLTVCGGVFRKE